MFRFTVRRLVISVVLISLGFGLFRIATHPWRLPLAARYDRLAYAEPPVRFATAAFGLVSLASGVVYLVVKQRRMRGLMHALCGALVGLLFGAPFAPQPFRSQPNGWEILNALLFASMAAGAILLPCTAAAMRVGLNRRVRRSSSTEDALP